MHGLILAGGEGSRLAADGLTTPKALVEVAGTPQLLRLVEQLATLGCSSITCMLNASTFDWLRDSTNVAMGSAARRIDALATVVPCRTPSSLHTFVAGLDHVPPGRVLATMVDSIMAHNDWQRFHARAAELFDASAEAVLALTPAVDHDDSPLWVMTDSAERVVAIGSDASGPGARVTGGVYAFSPGACQRARAVLASGRHRMRNFLGELVASDADVRAVDLPRIIDIDHRSDLERANAYMSTLSGADRKGAHR